MRHRTLLLALALASLPLLTALVAFSPLQADGLDPKVQASEAQRIALVQKVQPASIAVFAGGQIIGSGVVISEDGYGLTNNHVAGPTGGVMKCGLPNGEIYDAVIVGEDKDGDIELIKLFPKKPGDKFPFAKLGDSDKVRPGDWSMAMGNPFSLSTDLTPTVTFGMVSGVHRSGHYVFDCIQVDTSINPGNSGGPLYNMDGELIGINGAISLDKRGRVNIGVGHSISINQIKNSFGHLRSGLAIEHASIGALFLSEAEEGMAAKTVVASIIPSDASRRGLEAGDQLVSFDGKPISSGNQLANNLGTYPKGWRVPMVFRRENARQTEKREILVRLMGVNPEELPDENGKPKKKPAPKPQKPSKPGSGNQSNVRQYYKPKPPTYANSYYNSLECERLLSAFKKQAGDFSKVQGDWTIKAEGTVNGKQASSVINILDKGAKDGKSPLIRGNIDGIDYSLEPLEVSQSSNALKDPPGSGGLFLALYQYHQFLALGDKGGFREFGHGGIEPFYPPAPGKDQSKYLARRILAEVVRTEMMGVPTKWYFSPKDGTLLGLEMTIDREEDPCEIYFSDYHMVNGRSLPSTIEVWCGDKQFARLQVTEFKQEAAK